MGDGHGRCARGSVCQPPKAGPGTVGVGRAARRLHPVTGQARGFRFPFAGPSAAPTSPAFVSRCTPLPATSPRRSCLRWAPGLARCLALRVRRCPLRARHPGLSRKREARKSTRGRGDDSFSSGLFVPCSRRSFLRANSRLQPTRTHFPATGDSGVGVSGNRGEAERVARQPLATLASTSPKGSSRAENCLSQIIFTLLPSLFFHFRAPGTFQNISESNPLPGGPLLRPTPNISTW